jgi:dihydroflavonol-4-reductase
MWLVTAATGHIGNVLVRKLIERGEKVRALVHRANAAPIEGLGIETVEDDVLTRIHYSGPCTESGEMVFGY